MLGPKPHGRCASVVFTEVVVSGVTLGPDGRPYPYRSLARVLRAHYDEVRDLQMRELFEEDPERAGPFLVDAGQSPLRLLEEPRHRSDHQLCWSIWPKNAAIRDWITRMFSGDAINETEDRAVLHTALRNRGDRCRHG